MKKLWKKYFISTFVNLKVANLKFYNFFKFLTLWYVFNLLGEYLK